MHPIGDACCKSKQLNLGSTLTKLAGCWLPGWLMKFRTYISLAVTAFVTYITVSDCATDLYRYPDH